MKPIIYQLFPRTFTNYNPTRKRGGSREENGCGTFNQFTPSVLNAIHDLGFNYVWYTGVIRHATSEYNNPSITKGKAGSPYAITDYYDVDPDLAENKSKRMAEFTALVERTHAANMQVMIDFVPNHVSREYHSVCKPKSVKDLGETDHPEWAFSPLNNFYYLPGQPFAPQFAIEGYTENPAKVTGNDCFNAHPNQNDWYETIKLNYGVHYLGGGEKQFDPIPDTWHKMLHILLFWAKKGIDAFRVDMAEMVPEEFWQWVIPAVKKKYPQLLFIAECYNPQRYNAFLAAGFDYLYDKVGMYEYLRGVTSKNWPVEGITGQWQAVEHIQDKMLYFLENHDEQRVASGFYCGRGVCAEPAMIVAATLGKNPVMVYAGQELGETGMDAEGFSGIDGRSSIFDYWGLKSIQAWANNGQFDGKMLSDEQKNLQDFYRKLLTLSRENKAITDGDMYDLEYAQGEGFNKHEQYAYLRKAGKELLLIILNFDDRQVDMKVRIPEHAFTHLNQPEWQQATAVDLLSKTKYGTIAFNSKQTIELTLPAWKGVILQVKESKPKKQKQ